MNLPPPDQILAIAIVIFTAIGIHEYAHAKFADMAGDPTPGMYGRVTLNLTKHFELLGTIMIVITSFAGVGIGWGKPVPMNPERMRNPRWDHLVAVLAGPVSNLVMAAVWAGILRVLMVQEIGGFFVMLSFTGVIINVSLFLFNLIPLGPLDGMWILGTFLNDRARLAWTRWNLTFGGMLFIGIVIFSQLAPGGGLFALLRAPLERLVRLLIGA